MRHPVRWGLHKNYAERLPGEGLLKLEVSVHRNQGGELSAGAAKQLAVLETFPTETLHRLHVMAQKFGCQVGW